MDSTPLVGTDKETPMNSTPSAPPARVDAPLVDLPAEGDVFSASWKLATGDMDARQHLRLDGVARYIQEMVLSTWWRPRSKTSIRIGSCGAPLLM